MPDKYEIRVSPDSLSNQFLVHIDKSRNSLRPPSPPMDQASVLASIRENTLKATVQFLEAELVEAKTNLASAEDTLAKTKTDLGLKIEERDQEIERLRHKLMQSVVDQVLTRSSDTSREAQVRRGRTTRQPDTMIKKEAKLIVDDHEIKRDTDETVEKPVTPKYQLRPTAPTFTPRSADSADAIIAPPPSLSPKQSSNNDDRASISLSPSFHTLHDQAFERLLLSGSAETIPDIHNDDNDVPSLEKGRQAKSQDSHSGTDTNIDSAETPCLDLPQSFLSKAARYREPNYIGASVTEFIPSTSETAKKFAKILRGEPASEIPGKKVFLSAPNDFAVRWRYQNVKHLFGDSKHFQQAHNQSHESDNTFWRLGLRYTPADPTEGNAYRTIIVEEIPVGATLKQVHELFVKAASKRVDNRSVGGTLESIQLFNTFSMSGSLTARVVYIYQEAAYDMINYVRHLKLQGRDGLFINDSKLHFVHMTVEATTPPPTDLAKWIYEYGFTRVLRLTNLTVSQVHMVKITVIGAIDMIEFGFGSAEEGDKRAMDVVLASIRDADIWKARMERDEQFAGVEISVGNDPCDVGLREIE